jgi:hypothetical protein
MSVFAEGPSLLKLAIGKGKFAKQQYGLTALNEVADALKSLPKDVSLEYQLRALRKAAKPGQDALRRQVSNISRSNGQPSGKRHEGGAEIHQQPGEAARGRCRDRLPQADKHQEPEDGNAGVLRRQRAERPQSGVPLAPCRVWNSATHGRKEQTKQPQACNHGRKDSHDHSA